MCPTQRCFLLVEQSAYDHLVIQNKSDSEATYRRTPCSPRISRWHRAGQSGWRPDGPARGHR